MKKFSLGYNQDIQMLGLVKIFKDYIKELSFPIPNDILGSGRVVEHSEEYRKEIKKIIKFCKDNDIEASLLVNPTSEGEEMGSAELTNKIIKFLRENKGIDSVVLTNPLHVFKIKKEFPEIKIISSVNCFVKNSESALYLKSLGFDEITIDRDINRDLALIAEIKKEAGSVRVMLNEGCLRNCPFRKAHFNMISHGNDTEYFDSNACIKILKSQPDKFFSIPFIRPEDLHYYDFADTFKLATRTTPTAKLGYVLEAYAMRKFDGDLLDLLSTRSLFGVFKKVDNKKLTEMKFFENITKKDNSAFVKKLMKDAVEMI